MWLGRFRELRRKADRYLVLTISVLKFCFVVPCVGRANWGVRMPASSRRNLSVAAAISAAALIGQADARWKPEYANAPPAVRDWYQHAELTKKAQMRFPFKSCCEHADVVRTQFRVSRGTGGDEWYWLDGQDWRRIPDDIIHWGETAPDKQPTLFIYQGKETCFWPGESGI
jgi:hypothetical protein